MDNDTSALLSSSLREMLSGSGGEPVDIRSALDELGWQEVIDDTPEASRLLFTEHGRALSNSRALDVVVLAELAPVLPASDAVRAVAYPTPSPSSRPTSTTTAIDGVVLSDLTGVDEVVAPVETPDGVALMVISTADLTAQRLSGIDTTISWHRVQGSDSSPTIAADGKWDDAVTAGRRALAAEILGASGAALALAIEHTSSRKQFGAPISSFQAVRHRLAEAHVALAATEGLLAAAWVSGERHAAAVAKASAGRSQALVNKAVLQVCGAVGLSLEHSLHRFVERAAVLDTLLTPHLILIEALGGSILAGGPIERVTEVDAS